MYIIEYETTVSKYVISNVIYDDDNNKIKGIGSFFILILICLLNYLKIRKNAMLL